MLSLIIVAMIAVSLGMFIGYGAGYKMGRLDEVVDDVRRNVGDPE